MKTQRPIVAEEEHRVLQFRPRTPAQPPALSGNAVGLPQREDQLSEQLDLSRYERPRDEPDDFRQRMLANIAGVSKVLDAETVVVGMQPAVAITLVELGLALPGVRTALNVDAGVELLRSSVQATEDAYGTRLR